MVIQGPIRLLPGDHHVAVVVQVRIDLGRPRQVMREFGGRADFLVVGRLAFELVLTLREQLQEFLERLLFERRLGALEEKLGESLLLEAAFGSDVK